MICDQNLKARNYSNYYGAELVAAFYKQHIPAILCTRWCGDEIATQIRSLKRYIPILIDPDALESEHIERYFSVCINEFKGQVLPSRKTWRTLVRVEYIDTETNDKTPYLKVIIPGWSSSTGIQIMKKDIPNEIADQIQEGSRLQAYANIGAETHEELYFTDWELIKA